MARLFSSGFESNSLAIEFGVTAGAAMTVQTSTVRSGTYAARVNGLSSGTRSGVFQQHAASAVNAQARFYLRIAAYPSAENRIAAWGTAIGTHDYGLTLGSDFVLRLYNGASVGVTSSGLSLNTWYRIETSLVLGGTDTLHLFVDGLDVGNFTTGSGVGSTGFFLGGNGNAEAQTTGDWFFDDFAVNDTTGTAQTGLPGAGNIVHLHPDSAGDFAEGTSTPGSTAGYVVTGTNDNPTPDDVTSYWSLVTQSSSSTTADRLDVNLEAFSPSATSITLVQVGVRMMPTSNAACNYISRIKSQATGTLAESAAISVTGTAWVTHDDTAPKIPKLTSYTDPQGGGAWTAALLNTMQIGVRSTDTTPNPRITAMWATVEYVAAAAAAQIPSSPFPSLPAPIFAQ